MPWSAAGNIDKVGEAAASQLQGFRLDKDKMTLIGESFGNYVNNRIAQELGGVDNIIALNPASELGGYKPSDLTKFSNQSIALQTYSVCDTNLPIADYNLFLETPEGAGPAEQHTYGIPWLLKTLEAGDTDWLLLKKDLKKAQFQGFFDGKANLDYSYTPNPFLYPSYYTDANITPNPEPYGQIKLNSVQAYDPNDKVGPSGFDSEGTPPDQCKRFIAGDVSPSYIVYFENLPTATAAAQEVLITDQLDSNLDWSSLAFGNLQIGTYTVSVPEGNQNFKTTIDLRPETPTIIEIDCNFNPSTGLAQWLFRGKDPYTGELADFLPPNTATVAPKGEGWVSYSVKPKPNLLTGTVIRNKATIDFEVDIPPAPMDTPEVFNTIDSGIPTSNIKPLPATTTSTSLNIEWEGSDNQNGSGIRNITLYVSDNNSSYIPCHIATQTTGSITFKGEYWHSYKFYSRALDNVGNIEPAPTTFDTQITLNPEGIRIEADKKAMPISGTATLYSFAQQGTESVPATWTISGNIGTLSSTFGTSIIFYATSTGIGTITATDGTNTAFATIIVGNLIDTTTSYIATLTTSWGTATIKTGTNTEALIILPPEPATGTILSKLPEGNIGIGITINAYGTSGQLFKGTLTNPIYIEIHYNEASLGNIDENTLALYISSDNGNSWGTISCSIDPIKNIIYGTFNHLSIIAPAGKSKQVASLDLTRVIAYPNPCKQYSRITFANLTDQCRIRIYNIAMELIFEQEYTNTNGKVSWDIKNKEGKPVASGVYIYLITNLNNKEDKAIGKIGIIK